MSEVVRLFEFAAKQNSPFAQASLGFLYWNGVPPNIPANITKAIDYFTEAASQNSSDAYWNLGLIYYEGVDSTSVVQDVHDDSSSSSVAVSIAANLTKAFAYFYNASMLGHWRAMYQLAHMLWKGEGINAPNCQKAIPYLKFVAEYHSVKFHLENARNAFEIEKFNQAFIVYAKMAEQGYLNGQINAAWLSWHGHGSFYYIRHPLFAQQSRKTIAYRYYHFAAIQHERRSLRIIGDYYWYGWPPVLAQNQSFSCLLYETAVNDDNFEKIYSHYLFCGRVMMGKLCLMLAFQFRNLTKARNIYWKALRTSEETLLPIGMALFYLELKHIWDALFLFYHIYAPSFLQICSFENLVVASCGLVVAIYCLRRLL
ncbi:hypothetical protein RFI_13364 [Reticulomyxa filosa]|uniref:Uncharacterized protein n=1 Tax=Reticulomyxa filosa TaxID=46433 RepID=X6NEP6_RETFI|nr:hypothetical protein RFI_13364 [Reticulomyxa filosa]|eukprot:ETO23812.1 hypothetical protein RFI_13364 [Reticulomyxa filosa]